MKSNFEFLNRYWPALAQIGAAAESYVYSDANACLYKLGMFGERLILEIFAFEHIKEPTIDNTHANRIRLLKREGLIPKKIDDILYALRKTRNDAVHAGADSVEDAKTLLSMTYNLAVWFMEVYGDWGYIAPAFVMPENVVQPDYESIIKEQEEKIVALSKQVDAVSTAASSKTSKERAEKGETASESMDLSEAETRYLIDEQFRKFGWEADTNNLRYSRGTRPQKGRNLAIAEWPTDSTVGKNGYADYALFVGLKLVGIVEAKKAAIDIPSVIDHQCKEYAKGIKAEHKDYVIGQWGAYKVPFVFATNGRKYLKQIETKSGIWCLDLRSGANAPKALQGWISPQGLMEQLEKDIAAANAAQINAVIIRLSFSFIILLSLSGAVLPALNSVYNNMLMCRFYQHISISVSSLFTSLRPLPARLAAAHPRFCSAPFQACGNGSAAFSPPARPPPRRNYASHIFNHIIHPPRTGLFHVKHSSCAKFI